MYNIKTYIEWKLEFYLIADRVMLVVAVFCSPITFRQKFQDQLHHQDTPIHLLIYCIEDKFVWTNVMLGHPEAGRNEMSIRQVQYTKQVQ